MAKVLHTSDWHIDRFTGRASRAADHEAVLAEICAITKAEQPDLVVNSGDLFQGVRPSTEGMRLAFDVLQEMATVCPVVVVCGNHDSAALFELFAQICDVSSRITFVARVRLPSEGGILDFSARGGKERIRVAPLPFIHANRVVGERAFGQSTDWTTAYAAYVSKLERLLGAGLQAGGDAKRDVPLFAAHLHVAGAQWSGSERPVHISEAYGLEPETVPKVAYAAFGHLHKPQALPGGVVGRFCGSPLQMDFGELGEEKGVVMIEAHPGQAAEVRIVPLMHGRRLRRLSGDLESVRQQATTVQDEIVRVVVQTETHTPQLSEMVAAMMPRATIMEVVEESADRRLAILDDTGPAASGDEPHFSELFAEFLREEGTRGAKADLVLHTFHELIAGVEEETRVEFPEEAALGDCCALADGQAHQHVREKQSSADPATDRPATEAVA